MRTPPGSRRLDAVDELITSGTYPIREVTVITDLRRAGWNDELAELADRWSDRRCGCGSSTSAATRPTTSRWSICGRSTACRWSGDSDALGGRDSQPDRPRTGRGRGQLRRRRQAEPRAPAHDCSRRHGARAAGRHVPGSRACTTSSSKLPQDDLPGDNRRLAVTTCARKLQMVLVDGEPSSEPLAGEVDFLALALSLAQGDGDAFRVEDRHRRRMGLAHRRAARSDRAGQRRQPHARQAERSPGSSKTAWG